MVRRLSLSIPALLAASMLLAADPATPAAVAETPAVQAPPAKAEKYEFPAIGEVKTVKHDEALAVLKSHGKKVLVVNFWATWCAPCVAELPHFAEAQTEFGDEGVLVVGYNMDIPVYEGQAEKTAKATIAKKGLNFPNLLLDVDPSVTFPAFSNEWVGALPATFYFDANGKLLGQRLEEVTHDQLFEDIRKHLAAQATPQPTAP